MRRKLCFWMIGILGMAAAPSTLWGLTSLKVGLMKLSSNAPLFLGMEKGFFEAEGIRVEPVWFMSAQPITVAMASRDVEVAATGLTAGMYNAVAQGARMVVVADKGREWPGHRLTALITHPQDHDAGIRNLKDLKGKRVGVTQVGSTFHYILGNLLERENLSLSDLKVVPLGGVMAMRDTVVSRQIEAAFLVQPHVLPLEKEDKARVLLWVGDHLPYQIAGICYGERMLRDRRTAVAFMKGYIRSCRHFADHGLSGKGTPEHEDVIRIISKHTGEKPEAIAPALPYIDRDGKLFAEDIPRQVSWYVRNGMVAKEIPASEVVDLSFWKEALEALEK